MDPQDPHESAPAGGHNTLADTVHTPDTIRESGRNLLAYRIRGGHYPRPDAIRGVSGMGARSWALEIFAE